MNMYDVDVGFGRRDPMRSSAPAFSMRSACGRLDKGGVKEGSEGLDIRTKVGAQGRGFSFGVRDKTRDGGKSRSTFRFYSRA